MRTEHRLTYLSAILGLAVWLLTPAIGLAQPRVAVMNFENNSTWGYWGDNLGAAAADELVTQLLKTGSYRMIERSQLAARTVSTSWGTGAIARRYCHPVATSNENTPARDEWLHPNGRLHRY